ALSPKEQAFAGSGARTPTERRGYSGGVATGPLLHEQHGTAAFDLASDLAMHVGRHAGHTARQNLAAFSHEFLEEIGILVINRLGGDIDAPARHRAVGAAESGTAFGGLGLHGCLPRLPVERMPLQERIVFL